MGNQLLVKEEWKTTLMYITTLAGVFVVGLIIRSLLSAL